MDTETKPQIDPIKVSVIENRLNAICNEIGMTMLRTSRSPIFSEARDFVSAIFDRDLNLVSQAAYIPVIMGALPFAMRSIAGRFKDDIEDGDIFILNDPYHGNNHPPDITIAKPVFHGGELVFWSVSKGHHADVGGGGVAGYNPGALSVWDECLRIPPAKLYQAGKLNEALWDTILLNLHLPFIVEGDLHCQVGAVTIGTRALNELLNKNGLDIVSEAIHLIFDAAQKQMVEAIARVPNGVYQAERLIDHDGINKDRMINVSVKLTVEDDNVIFDFSDSDPQAAGYVNSTLPNTVSSAFLALYMCLGEELRFNEGALRQLKVIAPEGSVVNPQEPAPVAVCTISPAQAIIEAVWLALSEAVPERVGACWARWCAPASMGMNPRTGRLFADIHFIGKGGAGATCGLDGWDHLGSVITAGGLRSPDPELHELVNPYTILQYELWPDSAGAGEWRGGLGVVYRWRVDADGIQVANFGGGNREQTKPFGLEGGQPAPPHRLYLHKGDETINVDAESFYSSDAGDVFEIFNSGGGGYGDPHKRDPERVREDVINGIVTITNAEKQYGVVIEPDSFVIDETATAVLRQSAS